MKLEGEPIRATRPNNFVVDDDNAMCESFAADSFHWLEGRNPLLSACFPAKSRGTSLVVDVRLPGLSGLDLSKRAGRRKETDSDHLDHWSWQHLGSSPC
jgi:FixJ family two-component response regulator